MSLDDLIKRASKSLNQPPAAEQPEQQASTRQQTEHPLERRVREAREEQERADRRTTLGYVREAPKALARGVAGAAGEPIRGFSFDVEKARQGFGLEPRSIQDTPLYRAGGALSEGVRERLPPHPDYEGTFALDAMEGAGSFGLYSAMGLLTRGLGAKGAAVYAAPVATAKYAGMSEAFQNIEQWAQENPELAAERGIDADAMLDFATHPAARLPGPIQVASVVSAIRPMTGSMRSQLMRRMVETGFNEFTVENLSAVLQNALRQEYDEDHSLWDDVPYRGQTAGTGAAAVALALSPFTTRGRRHQPPRRPSEPDAEPDHVPEEVRQYADAMERHGVDATVLFGEEQPGTLDEAVERLVELYGRTEAPTQDPVPEHAPVRLSTPDEGRATPFDPAGLERLAARAQQVEAPATPAPAPAQAVDSRIADLQTEITQLQQEAARTVGINARTLTENRIRNLQAQIREIETGEPAGPRLPETMEIPSADQRTEAPAQEQAPQPETPQPEPVGARQPPRTAYERRRVIDEQRDDILAAIGKLGGISRGEAEAQGLDPAIWSTRGGASSGVFGMPWVRKTGGRSFDDIAESLAEYGYFRPGEEVSPNTLMEKLDAHMAGDRQLTQVGIEAPAAEDAADAEQAQAEAAAALPDVEPTDPFADAVPVDWEAEGISPLDVDESGYNDLDAAEQAAFEQVVEDAMEALGEARVSDILERLAVATADAPRSEYQRAVTEALRDEVSQAADAEDVAEPATGAPGAGVAVSREGDRRAGPQEGEGFGLATQTEESLAAEQAAREQARQQEAEEQRAQEQRARADAEVDSFGLTGSDLPADQAAAAGQQDLLAAPPRTPPQQTTPEAPAETGASSFVPTHELPTGEQVRATDEDGVYVTREGEEVEDANARPIRAEETAEAQPDSGAMTLDQVTTALREMRQQRADQGMVTDARLNDRIRRFEQLERELRAEPDGAEQAPAASLTEQLASMDESELSALIDDVAAETGAAQTDKPAGQREKRATKASGKTRPRKARAKVERDGDVDETARQIAGRMGVNLSSAGQNAVKGLAELFGGKGTLRSGLTFDEQTYAKAKPHFQAMLKDFEAAGKDMREFVRAVLDNFGTGVKPYLMRFAQELRDGDALSPDSAEIETVLGLLRDGQSFRNITEARKVIGEALGRTIKPGTAEAKRLEEVIESAALMRAREIVAAENERVGADSRSNAAFAQLLMLQERLPNLSTRTSRSVAMQAYSTPLAMAYVASRLAGVSSADVVYEPTAGNGALLMESDPSRQTVYANEMDGDRAQRIAVTTPGAIITTEDATTSNPEGPVNAIVANPPFGTVRDENNQTRVFNVAGLSTREVDHAILLHSLESLADDGNAVFIIGSVQGRTAEAREEQYRTTKRLRFFKTLYDNYNVTGHVSIDGKLYGQQGAAYPVDMIVIEGRGASALKVPGAEAPPFIDNWGQLGELLHDRSLLVPEARRLTSAETGRSADREGAATDPGTVPGPVEQSRAADDRGQPESGRVRGRAGADAGRGRAAAEPARDERRSRPDADTQQPDAAGLPAADGAVAGASAEGRAGDATGTRGVRADDTAGVAEPAAAADTGVTGTERQAAYRPASKARSVGTLVPVNMQTSTQRALRSVSRRAGSLDQFVASALGMNPKTIGNYFSAEQIDALSLAIDNFNKNAAFIIGDQTGVGKGRVVAGIIRYAIKQGRTPIFVTEKPNLYADMFRDLNDIGFGQVKMLMTNSGEKIQLDDEGKQLLQSAGAAKHNKMLGRMAESRDLQGHDVIFTTYSQMQPVKQERTTRMAFLEAFADGGVVIFDESHNAGGQDAQGDDARGSQDRLSRAGFARDMARLAHSVMYSSATYAKRPGVMDLYFRTDMGMAVDSIEALPDAIAAGGVPLQQVVAAMLSEAGQYIRRERSFEGVRYETSQTSVNTDLAEAVSRAMGAVHSFDEAKNASVKEIKKRAAQEARRLDMDPSVGEAGMESSNFTSVMHNLIDQVLLSLKMEATAKEAIAALENGQKPVITVANTMGSFIQQFAHDMDLAPGDPITLSFTDLLTRYLEKSRMVILKDGDGKRDSRRLRDDDLSSQAKALYRQAKRIIEESDLEGIPISPIDYLRAGIEAAGYRTTEITGRRHVIDYSGEAPVYRMRPESEVSINGRRRAITGYNSGEIDAIILNQSGSTGISLHASEKFKDQKQRVMIIAQPEKNIDTHMQMLGRVHRTGQVVTPVYKQLVANIPAEKRPAAMLAKKMASLNANTTASRGSDLTAENVPDFMNEFGDQVAARLMMENPQINRRLGYPVKKEGDEGAMRKVTGRIPLLPISEQAALYESLEAEYADLIQRLEASGTSPLEAKTLDLDARTIERTTVAAPKSDADSPFAASAIAERVDMKRVGKPMRPEEVVSAVQDALDTQETDSAALERLGREQVNALAEQARSEFQTYSTNTLDQLTDDGAISRQRTALDGFKSLFNERIRDVHPGRHVLVSMTEGSFRGVVLRVERKGRATNPLAPSDWRVSIALADPMRTITLPFSQIGQGEAAAARITPQPGGIERAAPQFERQATQSREERTIITGNLLAGYEQFKRGQIINFTDNEGAIRQGILMPKDFDLAEARARQPVRFDTAEQVMRFMETVGGQAVVKTADGSFSVRPAADGGFLFTTPASKARGGRHFLNPGILSAAGQDFVKAGQVMRLTVDRNRAEAVVAEVLKNDPMQTEAHKDQAESIMGRPMMSRDADTARSMALGRPDGMPVERVQTVVDRATRRWKSAPPIQVIDTVLQLPADLLRQVRAAGDVAGIRGIYHRGQVYLIASNLPNARSVERVVLHEVVGHYGLRSMLGDRLLPVLNQVWTAYGQAGHQGIIDRYFDVSNPFDPQNRIHRYIVAEEKLAHLAEEGGNPGIIRRLQKIVQDWLRAMGFTIRLNQADMVDLLRRSRQFIEGRGQAADPGQTPGAGQPVASRAEPSPVTGESVRAFAKDLENRLGLRTLFLSYDASRNLLKLDSIIVEQGDQGAGKGSQAMEAITAYADRHGLRMALSPGLQDGRHGTTSRARLVRFYKRFGFVENKGRNKDFTIQEGMIREPEISAESEPRFSRNGSPRAQQEQARFLSGLAAGQPIDRMFRLPFALSGMVDSHGRFKPGVAAVDATKHALTEWNPSPDGNFAWMNSILETARAGLIDRYDLPEGFRQREAQAQSDERRIQLQGMEILQTLEKNGVNNPAEAAVLQAILAEGEIPSAEWAKLSEPIRRAMDEMGQELVNLGLITGESYQRNVGQYLHRSYMRHESAFTGASKWMHDTLTKRRRKIQGDALKERGMRMPDVTQSRLLRDAPRDWWGEAARAGRADPSLIGKQFVVLDRLQPIGEGVGTLDGMEDGGPRRRRVLDRIYWPADREIPARFSGLENRGTWEVRSSKGDKLSLWRDFTREERMKMGEILDARYNIAKTFQTLSHDIAMGRFFRDIAKNPEWAVQDPGGGTVAEASEAGRMATFAGVDWVRVPTAKIPGTSGVSKWGDLAGMYVRPEIWRDLNELDKMQSNGGMWRKLLTQWKLNKALSLDTPLPTPSGWTTMGEIKEGDELFDEKGQVCRVLEVKDIQHGRPCYRVEFSDGTSIVADDEHWWFTKHRNRGEAVRTTQEIRESLTINYRGEAAHSIPVAGAMALEDADLPLPPYALGLWLGDGHSASPRVTMGSTVADEVEAHLREFGMHCGKRRYDPRSSALTFTIDTQPVAAGSAPNLFKEGLKALGVLGNKQIPPLYLRASTAQRLSLLQGLMDADGWVTTRGDCGFGTSMPALRDGVLELLRSLGLKPTCRESVSVSGKPTWRISFRAYADTPVCRVEAKRSRLKPRPDKPQRSSNRQIVAVEPVESVPVRCIMVSSESQLYLAGEGMVPTHNTARSPVVHMNNVMSNLILMDLIDVRMQDLVGGLREYVAQGAEYREAMEYGAFGSTFVNQEIRRKVMEPLIDEIRAQVLRGEEAGLDARANVLSRMSYGIWRRLKAVDSKMVDIYQIEDEIFRMATYMRRRSMGDTPQEAAMIARDQFLNYDIRAPWVNAMRATVLPFISYTYRAVPAVAQAIAHRPWKIAKYATLTYLLNWLSYELVPGDEDEERRTMREEMQGRTWIGTPRTIRMPYRDAYDNPVFLDIRRWIPAGDVFDTHQGQLGVPAPLQLGGPLMMGAELFLNKTAFTGDEIVNPLTDDWWDRSRKRADWFWKSWMPSAAWIPGGWHNDSIMRAATGGLDSRGRPYSMTEAVLGAHGIKARGHDVDLGYRFRALEIERTRRGLENDARTMERNLQRNLISRRQYDREMQRIRKKAERLRAEADALRGRD